MADKIPYRSPERHDREIHFRKGVSTSLSAPIPSNEAMRVAALRAYDILDTAEEEIFDSVIASAAQVCSTPMAALTFVDKSRTWVKASVGMPTDEEDRNVSFCAYAINGADLFVVEDATRDPRFCENPFVTGGAGVRFYAGMPLLTPGGLSLGALCVLDTVPRALAEEQVRTLRKLAQGAMRVLNLRRNLGMTVFANTVDLTSDGISISSIAPEGATIIHANESFLKLTGFEYHEAINQPSTFPLDIKCEDVANAFKEALTKRLMATAECQFRTKTGQHLWDRVSFVPYFDGHCQPVYVVALHRNINAQKLAEAQMQQLYAMRTTMATVNHVIRNFMNAARLYSMQISVVGKVDSQMQSAFEAALQSASSQLSTINQMSRFKDRPTPFGISLLDTEDAQSR